MAILGADPDDLDDAARAFDDAKAVIERTVWHGSRAVGELWWIGLTAENFRSNWNGRDVRELRDASASLDGMAARLREQARQQRHASRSERVARIPLDLSSMLPWPWRWWRNPEREWYRNEGLEQLAAVRYADAQAQLAWWNGLTDAQREFLLRNEAGELAFMDGLPPEVREEALANWREDMESRVEVRSETDSAGVAIDISIGIALEAEVGIGSTVTEYADGSVVVTLELDAEVAAGLGLGGNDVTVGVGGEVAASFRFDSADEAEEFLQGLKDEFIPNVRKDWTSFLAMPVFGAGGIAADALNDARKYMDGFSRNRESRTIDVHAGIEADFGVPENSVSVGARAGGSHDLDSGETTLYYELNLEAEVGMPAVGAEGEAGVRVEAIFKDGELVGVAFSGQAQGSVGASALAGPLGANFDVGGELAFTASVDLDNPMNREIVQQYLDGGGDVSFSDVLGRAEVVAYAESSTSGGVSGEGDAGFFDFEAGVEQQTTERNVTYIKPPGGDFVRFDAPEASSGGGTW